MERAGLSTLNEGQHVEYEIVRQPRQVIGGEPKGQVTPFRRAAPGKQNDKCRKALGNDLPHYGRMVSDGSLQKCCMHAAHRFSKSDLPWRSFKSTACHHRRAVGRLSILRDPGAFQHWPDRAAKGDAFLREVWPPALARVCISRFILLISPVFQLVRPQRLAEAAGSTNTMRVEVEVRPLVSVAT